MQEFRFTAYGRTMVLEAKDIWAAMARANVLFSLGPGIWMQVSATECEWVVE